MSEIRPKRFESGVSAMLCACATQPATNPARNFVHLRNQKGAAGSRTPPYPCEMVIGDLLSRQTRSMQAAAELLQRDDGLSERWLLGWCCGMHAERAGDHLCTLYISVTAHDAALAVALSRPYEGSPTDTSGGNA